MLATGLEHEGHGERSLMSAIVGIRQSPARPEIEARKSVQVLARFQGPNYCNKTQQDLYRPNSETLLTNTHKFSVGRGARSVQEMASHSLSASVLPNKIQQDPCRAKSNKGLTRSYNPSDGHGPITATNRDNSKGQTTDNRRHKISVGQGPYYCKKMQVPHCRQK